VRAYLRLSALLCAVSAPVMAQDTGSLPTWPGSGESVSVEPFVGYLRGTSTENVYDPTSRRYKVSQLDWNVDAVTVGGRVALRPLDGLTLRGHFWTAVASDGAMTDRDWLGGSQGSNNWTHRSIHPDTRIPKAWQADVSAAYAFYQDNDVAVAALAGFRHYEVRYRANGGSYVYSQNGFRDLSGNFTPGQLGIAYQQWWDTPYIGMGAYYRSDDLSVSTELYGSPFTFTRDKDYHALRYTIFKENFSTTGMVGANLTVEYKITPMISIAGRLDYTRYIEAEGGTKMFDYASNTFRRFPKPSAGADADTLHMTLGIKSRI
jgi:outer membrane protease